MAGNQLSLRVQFLRASIVYFHQLLAVDTVKALNDNWRWAVSLLSPTYLAFMDEYHIHLPSQPILDADDVGDEFNPHDLVNEQTKTYIHANPETSIDDQAVRTSAASTAS